MKYTKEQSEVYLNTITRSDIEAIANKYSYGWQTLYDILRGARNYDTGRPERKAMIAEAKKLIKQRAINALEVIEPKTVK